MLILFRFKKVRYIFFIFGIAVCSYQTIAQPTSYLVDSLTNVVDGNNAPFNQVQGGDTIFLEAGIRSFLLFKNLTGSPSNPFIIINRGGVVDVNTTNYYGISIQNCRYFRLTGQGSPDNFYGIKISYVANGAGIGIGAMSSDYEIDHVSVENTFIGGIYAKTDPDCTFQATRDKFTQYNTVLHDNYIAHVADEGMYIGSSKYLGQTVNCNGADTTLFPSVLEGVRIYNNILKFTGWDGIQVSSASSDCQVYNNMILYDSQDEHYGQMSGILLGGGSKCDCYNNFISQGKGNGIESHGLGGYRIFNNIILDAGKSFLPFDTMQMKHGIFVTDVSVQQDSSFYILHNHIINPKSEGIRFQSIHSKNSLIVSNLIVNPGNYDLYENGNTSFTGQDAYVMFPDTASDVIVDHNFFTREIDSAGISAIDYTIQSGSPLIDAGYADSLGISFDFYMHLRPYGLASDIGAFEFDPAYVGIPENTVGLQINPLPFPNPVKTLLTIKYRSQQVDDVILDIYNLQGKPVIQSIRQPGNSGQQQFTVNVEDYPSGIYIYTLRSGKSYETGRFIKVN